MGREKENGAGLRNFEEILVELRGRLCRLEYTENGRETIIELRNNKRPAGNGGTGDCDILALGKLLLQLSYGSTFSEKGIKLFEYHAVALG
jgi:hypothetical protein